MAKKKTDTDTDTEDTPAATPAAAELVRPVTKASMAEAAAPALEAERLEQEEAGRIADTWLAGTCEPPASWSRAVLVMGLLHPGLPRKQQLRKAKLVWPKLYQEAGEPRLR